ncbi:MAG: GTP-binding protein [Bryobacterales bacterium]|nr:GTP-binding protein [Bryobacterales bacterium]
MTILLRVQGEDLFWTKGILHVRGMKERFVIQAVHMMLDGGPDRPWALDEPRKSRLVFIGRNLDREALLAGLRSCIASPAPS